MYVQHTAWHVPTGTDRGQSITNAVVTYEIKFFKIISAFVDVRLKGFISARGNLPEIISKFFKRITAAHEYFPTCST